MYYTLAFWLQSVLTTVPEKNAFHGHSTVTLCKYFYGARFSMNSMLFHKNQENHSKAAYLQKNTSYSNHYFFIAWSTSANNEKVYNKCT